MFVDVQINCEVQALKSLPVSGRHVNQHFVEDVVLEDCIVGEEEKVASVEGEPFFHPYGKKFLYYQESDLLSEVSQGAARKE